MLASLRNLNNCNKNVIAKDFQTILCSNGKIEMMHKKNHSPHSCIWQDLWWPTCQIGQVNKIVIMVNNLLSQLNKRSLICYLSSSLRPMQSRVEQSKAESWQRRPWRRPSDDPGVAEEPKKRFSKLGSGGGFHAPRYLAGFKKAFEAYIECGQRVGARKRNHCTMSIKSLN